MFGNQRVYMRQLDGLFFSPNQRPRRCKHVLIHVNPVATVIIMRAIFNPVVANQCWQVASDRILQEAHVVVGAQVDAGKITQDPKSKVVDVVVLNSEYRVARIYREWRDGITTRPQVSINWMQIAECNRLKNREGGGGARERADETRALPLLLKAKVGPQVLALKDADRIAYY